MSRKARIAVIGAGWWSTTAHLPAIVAQPDAELAALIDPDPERLARAASAFGNPKTYLSLAEALASQALDAAVIATPHATHFALARQCLAAGLHVLIEKPMTLLAVHARILQAQAQHVGRELVIGYPWNYTEQARATRAELAPLGPIHQVTAFFSSYHYDLLQGASREGSVHGPTSAYADPTLSGGGHGHLQVTHILGLLFFVADLRMATVQARMSGLGLPLDVADAYLATFDNGALGLLGGTSASRQSRAFLRLDAEHGSLELDPLTWGYPLDAPVKNLIAVTLGQEPNHCPAEVGCRAVEVLDAAYRSAQNDGAPVTLEDLQ